MLCEAMSPAVVSVHAAVTAVELNGEDSDQMGEVAAAGALISLVTETLLLVAEFPAASAMIAVSAWAATESPVVLMVADHVVPLQLPPTWLAALLPSTLTVTVCEFSLQVPETAKVAEFVDALM